MSRTEGRGRLPFPDLSCEPAVLIDEIPCGRTSPRQFAFIKQRLWVGNQLSDNVRSYRVQTGAQDENIVTD
jgi:hypothetical protein